MKPQLLLVLGGGVVYLLLGSAHALWSLLDVWRGIGLATACFAAALICTLVVRP